MTPKPKSLFGGCSSRRKEALIKSIKSFSRCDLSLLTSAATRHKNFQTRSNAQGYSRFAVLLAASLLAWAGVLAWYDLNHLRKEISVVQSSSFHLAEHIPEKMLALNATLRSLGSPPDPAVMADFQRQAADMKLWVRTNKLLVTSAPQRDTLGRIEAALDDYVTRATRLEQENMRAASGAQPRAAPERAEQDPSPIPALAAELRAAEQAALQRFVTDSRRSMGRLYFHVLFSAGVALVLGVAALRVIQVVRIAPLEAKLARSHSLLYQQEKLAALGTLAAGVAHEVRNPLTAIKLRLNSLKRATPGNASAADDLAVINAEVKRLERIVGDVLQFARPTAPRIETFSPRTLFEQVQHLFGPQLEAAGIRLQLEAPPEVSVQADSQQIQQVLINLVQNAADNTPRGGFITLRARAGKARLPSGPAPVTILEVADTGKGIAPEVAKRLFDPFFRGASRAGRPPAQQPRRPALRRRQLHRPPGNAGRERAIRPRAGRLYQRPRPPPRTLRGGRRGHGVPRRNWRPEPRHPGQAVARASGKVHSAGGRQRNDPRGRPSPGRHPS